jgi:hypothetical protein
VPSGHQAGATAALRRSEGAEGAKCPLAVDDAAETNPAGAVEAAQLHLLDRRVIGRARIKGDARQQHRHMDAVHVGRLMHQVFPRQLVAARGQQMHHRGGMVVAMTLAQSLGSASGLYFFKKATYSATSGSSFQVGSPGSLRKAAVTRPTDLSSPAGCNVSGIEAAGKLTICNGFQPMS